MDVKTKKTLVTILMTAMVFFMMPTADADAASKLRLNKTKVTVAVGKTVKIKVKNTKAKVKWSSKNKKIASVRKGIVKGKKAGKTCIYAKVGNKKLKCKVTVKEKGKYVVTAK